MLNHLKSLLNLETLVILALAAIALALPGTMDPAAVMLAVITGAGIIPSGNVATELTYVTRRAFVPKLVVQLYNASPTAASLLSNSQPAYGGVSSVSVPVQGAAFVTGQFSDYSGQFNQPAAQQGAYLTEQALKLFIVPIPFLGMEGVVQLDHAVIPLIEARMNDATNVTMDTMSTALFSNYSDTTQFIGFPGAIDDSTNLNVYGNINRTNNTWWKSKVYAAGSVNPTRQLVLQYIAGVTKNGAEVPSFGVMGFGTWTLLAQDFIGVENYRITPDTGGFDQTPDGPRSGFRALMVAGVPIFADPYCPEGLLYLVNSNYLNLYVHVNASFAFTGFESTISNWQLGYVGALVTIAELVSVKPKSMGRVGGFNSLTL
jgi:hypothetical protein